jgi:hypothetical protein
MRALATTTIFVLALASCAKRDATTSTTTTTSADLGRDASSTTAAADTTTIGESIPGGTSTDAAIISVPGTPTVWRSPFAGEPPRPRKPPPPLLPGAASSFR